MPAETAKACPHGIVAEAIAANTIDAVLQCVIITTVHHRCIRCTAAALGVRPIDVIDAALKAPESRISIDG